MNEDVPLFESVFAALRFAFNQAPQVAGPLMNKLAVEPSRPGRGLGGEAGGGQAGMIKARFENALPAEPERAVIIAKMVQRSFACDCTSPCCAGIKPNRQWTAAIALLTDYVRVAIPAISRADALVRRECVVRFFERKDDKKQLKQIATQCGLHPTTVKGYAEAIAKALKNIEKDAMTRLDAAFENGPVGAQF